LRLTAFMLPLKTPDDGLHYFLPGQSALP